MIFLAIAVTAIAFILFIAVLCIACENARAAIQHKAEANRLNGLLADAIGDRDRAQAELAAMRARIAEAIERISDPASEARYLSARGRYFETNEARAID